MLIPSLVRVGQKFTQALLKGMDFDIIALKSYQVYAYKKILNKDTYLASIIPHWGIYPKEIIQNIILLCLKQLMDIFYVLIK